jgi:hypothetical protein
MTKLSPLSSKNSSTVLLYVVQRCWHSGPQQYQPLDFLRLFHTQRDAEEAAYHSAHAWSNQVQNGRNDVPIKTLLLPSYPDHNPQGSSYGFIACGTLFWVRALRATMVTARHHNRMFDYNNNSNNNNNNSDDQSCCHSAVYVVITEGVIGGTGNHNSRRGTEVCEGRVFGGDASSHKWAMETLQSVQAGFQAQGGSMRNVEIKLLSVGKPENYYLSDAFLKDWPPQVLQPTKFADSIDMHPLHKRQYDENEFWVTQEEEGMVVDCPFETPMPKRRRFDPITPNSSMGGESATSALDTLMITTTITNNNNNSNDDMNNSHSMFHGKASGGLMVLRGGVFVGATTGSSNHGLSPSSVTTTTTINGSDDATSEDVPMT